MVIDDVGTIGAAAFSAFLGEGKRIRVTGLAEFGLAAAVVAVGYGAYKFLSNSYVRADDLPDINVGGIDVK